MYVKYVAVRTDVSIKNACTDGCFYEKSNKTSKDVAFENAFEDASVRNL
jgi:hypothetical protein